MFCFHSQTINKLIPLTIIQVKLSGQWACLKKKLTQFSLSTIAISLFNFSLASRNIMDGKRELLTRWAENSSAKAQRNHKRVRSVYDWNNTECMSGMKAVLMTREICQSIRTSKSWKFVLRKKMLFDLFGFVVKNHSEVLKFL